MTTTKQSLGRRIWQAPAPLWIAVAAIGAAPASGCAGTKAGGEFIQTVTAIAVIPIAILAKGAASGTELSYQDPYPRQAPPCPTPWSP